MFLPDGDQLRVPKRRRLDEALEDEGLIEPVEEPCGAGGRRVAGAVVPEPRRRWSFAC